MSLWLSQLGEGLRRFFESYMAEEKAARDLMSRMFLLQKQAENARQLQAEREKSRRESTEEMLKRIGEMGTDVGLGLGLGPTRQVDVLSKLMQLAFLKATKPPEVTQLIQPNAYSPGGLMTWGGFSPLTPHITRSKPGEALTNLGVGLSSLQTGQTTVPAGPATKILPQGSVAIEEGTGRQIAAAPRPPSEVTPSLVNVGGVPFLVDRQTGKLSSVIPGTEETAKAFKKALKGVAQAKSSAGKIRAAQMALQMLNSEYEAADPVAATRRQLLGTQSKYPPLEWLESPEGKSAMKRILSTVSALTGVPVTEQDILSATSGGGRGYEWVYRGGKLEYVPASPEEDEEED